MAGEMSSSDPVSTGMEVYYDRRAREYDDFYTGEGLYATRDRPLWFEDRAALERVIADLSPAEVLDVACGTGLLTQSLAGEVTAFDQSQRMLDVAKSRVPSARFVRGSAFDLPFEDGAFDRVFTGHFYGHLRPLQREAFLAEARRVAPELVIVDAARRPGGPAEEIQERPLLVDGSVHEVYKRWFSGRGLVDELGGGQVLHDGPWFVVVVHRFAA
jgi:ubiquinone/menaquinone biosynthesis C-methylase UbiE